MVGSIRATPAISVDSLTKRYGERTVLHDVSFTVPPGSVTGFLGPNGAGKTTTLRILLGLAAADGGSATVLGRPYAELPHPGLQVGAMLETSGFHPGRTATDHLTLTALQADLPLAGVAHVLERVQLTEAADRRVGQYSLGMRQRLGLAGALLGDPQVVILDEPANGLDPAGVRWLREQLRQLAAEGRAVLVSSHGLAEIEQTVDRVVILREGRVIAEDRLDALLDAAGATLEDVFFGLTDGTDRARTAPRAATGETAPSPAVAHRAPVTAAHAASLPAPPARAPASIKVSAITDSDALSQGLRAVLWPAEPQIVAVCAAKGGVGCTTTALGVADALAVGSGRRVACLDGDPAAPALLAIAGGDPGHGLDEIVDRRDAITNAAELAAHALRRPPYCDVFGFVPGDAPSALGPPEYAALLELLARHYELIVVDVGDSPFAPLGALFVGCAAHVIVATTTDRVATAVTATALAGLDPRRTTLLVNSDEIRLPVEVAMAARAAHDASDRDRDRRHAAAGAPIPPRLGASVSALTAGTPLALPFDRRLADPPWNPGGLGEATAKAFKRLALAVAEELR